MSKLHKVQYMGVIWFLFPTFPNFYRLEKNHTTDLVLQLYDETRSLGTGPPWLLVMVIGSAGLAIP